MYKAKSDNWNKKRIEKGTNLKKQKILANTNNSL